MADRMTPIATETVLVTRSELVALRDAEEAFAAASRALTQAENAVKPLRLALAEKVLGIKTSDELKAMAPEEVDKRVQKRIKSGAIEIVRGAPRFKFVKTSAGRYPAWKAEFIAAKGEVAAEKLTAETPSIFSYRVEVAASL